MATGKPKSGAGPYAGYKKNYQPIKSSKGTKAENLVQKGLRAVAKDGSKTARVKGPDGKMRTVTVMESGGLGKVVSSVAKNLLPKDGKVVPATNTGRLTSRIESANPSGKGAPYRPTPKAKYEMDKRLSEQKGRMKSKMTSKPPGERGMMKRTPGRLEKAVARSGEFFGAPVTGNGPASRVARELASKSPTNSARQTKVPVKGSGVKVSRARNLSASARVTTSPKKKGK